MEPGVGPERLGDLEYGPDAAFERDRVDGGARQETGQRRETVPLDFSGHRAVAVQRFRTASDPGAGPHEGGVQPSLTDDRFGVTVGAESRMEVEQTDSRGASEARGQDARQRVSGPRSAATSIEKPRGM